jgi:hypothetical protein
MTTRRDVRHLQVTIVNQLRHWVGKAFPLQPANGETARLARITQYLYNRRVDVTSLPPTALPTAAIQTRSKPVPHYYRTLLKLLVATTEELIPEDSHGAYRAAAAAQAAAFVAILLSRDDLQVGLINACVEVVNYCNLSRDNALEGSFPALTTKMGRLRHGLELYVVSLISGKRWHSWHSRINLSSTYHLQVAGHRLGDQISPRRP